MGTLSDLEADWPRISRLLDEAMTRPAAERAAFIDALPPPDDRLRAALHELLTLQAEVETDGFMDALPVIPGLLPEPLNGGAGALGEGAEVGPYRLLRPLGEGGMGAVWLAERADGSLKRKVALKLPRLAWAQDLALRMARERDILSALEHPNIARLYDAGVDAVGRPWLAIEYVEGRDLASFCDAARLDLRARVRLFLQVLAAVQYAHGNLVIHRDLKPANILVTPLGEARLLDFGIARLEEGAAEAGPDLTRTGVSAMTPRYASPEQVLGKRLTVASDLYSLGVVLHELLTGAIPYLLRRESRAEYEQAIVESELRVPSRLKVTELAAAARGTTAERIARELRGDLDAVLLRALARAPEGRYVSAAAFRDDLERWLDGRTVTARPPSRLHSLRKFVVRNRLAVGATAAAALALVAVSVVAVVQAQRAARSADEALAEAARANVTKDFLLSTYAGADPTLRGGRDATAKELLIDAEKQLDTKLKGQPELQAEVLKTLEEIWDLLGDADGSQRAADRRKSVWLGVGRPVPAADAALSAAEIAIKRRAYGEVERKLSEIGTLIDIKSMSNDFQARFLYLRGNMLAERGDRSAALEVLDDAVSLSRRSGDDQALFLSIVSRVALLRTSGDPVRLRRDVAEAETLMPRLDVTPVNALANRFQIAMTRYLIGDYAGGWPDMQRIIEDGERLYGADNPSSFPDRTYWLRYCLRLGEAKLAADWLRESAARGDRSVLREFERDPQWRILVARVHMAQGQWVAAREHLSAAERQTAAMVAADPQAAGLYRARVGRFQVQLASRQGFAAEALRLAAEHARRGDGTFETGDDRYHRRWTVGVAARLAGRTTVAVRELREAEAEAVALFGRSHIEVALLRLDLALAAAPPESGFGDGAVAGLVRAAEPVLREALPDSHLAVALVDRIGSVSVAGDRSAPDWDLRVRQRLAAVPSSVFLL